LLLVTAAFLLWYSARLVVVAGLWLVSLLFVGSARASFRREPIAVPAE